MEFTWDLGFGQKHQNHYRSGPQNIDHFLWSSITKDEILLNLSKITKALLSGNRVYLPSNLIEKGYIEKGYTMLKLKLKQLWRNARFLSQKNWYTLQRGARASPFARCTVAKLEPFSVCPESIVHFHLYIKMNLNSVFWSYIIICKYLFPIS